jgi:hypothetical protein
MLWKNSFRCSILWERHWIWGVYAKKKIYNEYTQQKLTIFVNIVFTEELGERWNKSNMGKIIWSKKKRKKNRESLHCNIIIYFSHTVKVVRGKVSFDSQNDIYTSQLSWDASPEAYLSLRVTVKRICHLVNEMWQIRLMWSFTGKVKWYFTSGPFYSAGQNKQNWTTYAVWKNCCVTAPSQKNISKSLSSWAIFLSARIYVIEK